MVLSMTSVDNMIFAGTMLGVSAYHTGEAEPAWETFIVPPIPEVTALACYNDSVVIGTPTGIYISSTEHPELIGMQNNLPGNYITDLRILSLESRPCLVANLREHGLYYFSDETGDWTGWNTGLPGYNILEFVQEEQGSGCRAVLEEGIYFSEHVGGTWTVEADSLPADIVRSLAVSGQYLFAATEKGVFRKNLLNLSWDSIAGLSGIYVVKLFKADPSSGVKQLIARTREGDIHYSGNEGETWNPYQPSDGMFPEILCIHSMDEIALAGTNGAGIYLSSGPGEWEPLNNGLYQADIQSLSTWNGFIIIGTAGAGIYHEEPTAGIVKINRGLKSLNVSYVKDAGPYAVACAGGIMYYYDNNAGQWNDFSYNMPNLSRCTGIHYPPDGSRMIVAKTSGIWYIDFMYEQQWHPLNKGLEGTSISRMLASGDKLYAATTGHGVFVFDEADTAWVQLTQYGLETADIKTLAVHDNSLYAGTYQGFFALNPPYDQWLKENTGLAQHNFQTLVSHQNMLIAAVFPKNCYVTHVSNIKWEDRSENLPAWTFIRDFLVSETCIYAGTNQSLWKRNLNDMYSGTGEFPSHAELICYPNPFSEWLYVGFTMKGSGLSSLELFDVSGKKHYQSNVMPNSHHPDVFSINTGHLPAGLYFLRLNHESGNITRKIIKTQ